MQPTQIALGVTQGAANLLDLDYTYGTTQNNGNVLSQTITVPTAEQTPGFVATQAYSYDSLNRIKQAAETIPNQAGWQQTFVYDRYGNRNFDEANTTTLLKNCMEGATPVVCAADVPVVNPSVNAANNRLNGYAFDASGNTKIDAEGRTFIYDSENKQAEVRDQANRIVGQYFYNGDGQRIKKVVPATGETTVFVYDASNRLVAEYSTVVEPPATAKTSYVTNDHLRSPRITTDQFGHVASRRDFHPFGEEIFRAGYGSDSVRQKFTGYERDNESDLDFAEARMYNFQHGRFTSPDDFQNDTDGNDPQSWNLYIYVRNKPLVMIDPTGKMGDFYEEGTGRWVGTDGKNDDKVYVAKVATEIVDNKGVRHWTFSSTTLLSIGHKEFQKRAATVYGESSAFRSGVTTDLANEMMGIAYVHQNNPQNTAYGTNNAQAQAFTNTTPEGRTGKMQLANFAILNALTGGPDPSNGANMWDGAEQALFSAAEKRTSVPPLTGKGKNWELHQNTMGWSISNQDYATWKANVGKGFKAPQNTTAVPNTPIKGNAGRTRLYSTAVYGRTIFWRVVP